MCRFCTFEHFYSINVFSHVCRLNRFALNGYMKLLPLLHISSKLIKNLISISVDHSYDNTPCVYAVASGRALWLFQHLHDNTINKSGNHSWAGPPTEVNFTASVQVKFSQNSGGTEFIRSASWAKPLLFKTRPQYTVGLWTLERKHGLFLRNLDRSWHFLFFSSFERVVDRYSSIPSNHNIHAFLHIAPTSSLI